MINDIEMKCINLKLTLKLGMDCPGDPFNMGMFYNSWSHSKWVCFQIPNMGVACYYNFLNQFHFLYNIPKWLKYLLFFRFLFKGGVSYRILVPISACKF